MNEPAADRPFRGNTARLAATMFLYLGLFAAVVSYGLMGDHWAHFFLFSAAAALPVVLVVVALAAWANRFSFDDEAKCIVKPGRPPVPYAQVTGVLLSGRGKVIDVFIRRQRRGTSFLVEALPLAERQRLENGLAARFPGLPVRQKRWGTSAAALTLLILLLAGFAAAHAYLYRSTPPLRLRPPAAAGDRDEAVLRGLPEEYVGDFAFVPPEGMKLISEQDNELFFEDKGRKLRLKVIANIRRPEPEYSAAFFRYAMGVRDYLELLDLTYQSRAGIVPVFLRSLELQGLENAAARSIGPPFLRGYLTQGKRGDEEETHIVLAGTGPREEIHFFLTGPERAPEQIIRTLLSGARLVGGPRT